MKTKEEAEKILEQSGEVTYDDEYNQRQVYTMKDGSKHLVNDGVFSSCDAISGWIFIGQKYEVYFTIDKKDLIDVDNLSIEIGDVIAIVKDDEVLYEKAD